MTKKQKPKPTPKPRKKPLHKEAKAAEVIPPVVVAAKRKPAPKPCPDCQYDDSLGTYGKCHICGTMVSYTGSNAHDAMPLLIRKTYFEPHAALPPEKRGPEIAWKGIWGIAYEPYRVYTLFGVSHTFCWNCVTAYATGAVRSVGHKDVKL